VSACESLPFGFPPPIDGVARPDRHWRSRLQEPESGTEKLAGPSGSPLMEFWRSAVINYTQCALTNRKDKMIAIWGIAKLVRDALGDRYGMGLWERNLEDQLTWRVANCTLREPPAASKFPSWSWASMDGQIEVSDRISRSNRKHWTVKNHSGQALQFDLKNVEHISKARLRPTQTRRMGDTVVEHRAVEEAANNLEPEFGSTSLPIAGHVDQGQIYRHTASKGWRLKIDGLVTDVEAFPDVVPNLDIDAAQYPYFVVLSAKQIVDSTRANVIGGFEEESDDEDSDDGQQLRERLATKAYYISGRGILMKEVGPGHFQRTGAFYFSRVEEKGWSRLLEPTLRNFWLD
jgi:hypothetical protein